MNRTLEAIWSRSIPFLLSYVLCSQYLAVWVHLDLLQVWSSEKHVYLGSLQPSHGAPLHHIILCNQVAKIKKNT